MKTTVLLDHAPVADGGPGGGGRADVPLRRGGGRPEVHVPAHEGPAGVEEGGVPGDAAALAGWVVRLLDPFVQEHELGELLPGPVDVILAGGDYLEPDLVFVGRERADLVTDRGIEGPPDLVVEILSPSTRTRDRGVKLDRYRVYGVPEYWVVDPDAGSVEVWRLAAEPGEPAVYRAGDRFRWTPAGQAGGAEDGPERGHGAALEVEVEALVGEG